MLVSKDTMPKVGDVKEYRHSIFQWVKLGRQSTSKKATPVHLRWITLNLDHLIITLYFITNGTKVGIAAVHILNLMTAQLRRNVVNTFRVASTKKRTVESPKLSKNVEEQNTSDL
jgi:hypothetical protein